MKKRPVRALARRRATYLTPGQQHNLACAARVLTVAFGFRIYQVGSSLERANYRDTEANAEFDGRRNFAGIPYQDGKDITP